MKNAKKNLHAFFIDNNGVDTIFKFLGHTVASAALFKLVPYLSKSNIVIAIITAILSIILLGLAFYNWVQKFWKPLIKAIYGDKESISKFEVLGGFKYFKRPDVIISFLACIAIYYIVFIWFNTIYEISIK